MQRKEMNERDPWHDIRWNVMKEGNEHKRWLYMKIKCREAKSDEYMHEEVRKLNVWIYWTDGRPNEIKHSINTIHEDA